MSLPRERILRRSADFAKVRKEGRPGVGRFLLVTAVACGEDAPSVFGFVTPRYVGKAHERNRTRRRLREIVKSLLPKLSPGYHVVTLARRGCAQATFAELAAEWRKLARRSRILENPAQAAAPPQTRETTP